MHVSAGPDFVGLGFVGGPAEEEALQGRAVKGAEGPKVAETCKGRCCENRE